jgi:hypothetical protein
MRLKPHADIKKGARPGAPGTTKAYAGYFTQPDSLNQERHVSSQLMRALIQLLTVDHTPREVMDTVSGASNGPALIHAARKAGIGIVTERESVFGGATNRGIYSLEPGSRAAALQLLRQLEGGRS